MLTAVKILREAKKQGVKSKEQNRVVKVEKVNERLIVRERDRERQRLRQKE